MRRTRTGAAEVNDSDWSDKPVELEERVDLDDDDDDREEVLEEEVEYEEVEEEVEVEEIEEIEEEVEEEVEEDEENEESDEFDAEELEKRKYAELLSLPPHGSEVYLGGIPTNASEEDLKELCESVGEVTEVRIMKEKESGGGKGYAFVTFRNKDLAAEAIEIINNSDFKGKRIKCSKAQAKHRLFIGNIPRNWKEVDMMKAVSDVGPGVECVELPKDQQNPSRNRGYVFIVYYNHACAEYSRQKMSDPKFKLDDNAPTVSWAEARNADSSSASQVRALYIKNLPRDITQDRLKTLFERHGKITKIVLPPAKPGKEQSRYGFVHYAERSSAMKALKNTERYEIDGHVLDCSLAKPQADEKSSGGSNLQKSTLQPNYPPLLGYGMSGGAYSALGAGLGATGFAQPLMHPGLGGPAPGGMAMMPILLPDGRIGYVLQQPGIGMPPLPPSRPSRHSPSPRGGRSAFGGSSSSGRRNRDSGRGRSRYNPY